MYVVTRTGAGLLMALGVPSTEGFREIVRVQAPRRGEKGSSQREKLVARTSSLRELDSDRTEKVVVIGARICAIVPGSTIVPHEGLPLFIKPKTQNPIVTGPLEFVEVLPANREWVLPYLLQAYEDGDRIAHHLVYRQPWEEANEPGASFIDRYQASRREAEEPSGYLLEEIAA